MAVGTVTTIKGPHTAGRAAQPQAMSVTPEAGVCLSRAELEGLMAEVAEAVAQRVGEEVADLLSISPPHADKSALEASCALLTVDEVVAARPGITANWLYNNAPACGAIQKNKTQRSPLWFQLPEVDAELKRRRKKPIKEAVEPSEPPTVRRHRKTRHMAANGSLTANGAPRSFDIRPRLVS